MKKWTLKSIPPHDWFICLDIDSYFDHEHDPETIYEEGYVRPITVGDRDVVVTIFFNGDVDSPEFHIECNEDLSEEEIAEANKPIARILGTDLDLKPLYDAAGDDPVLGPKLEALYGVKRMSRATLFDDIVNRIVQMQIHHAPTARKMMYRIRESYGTAIPWKGSTLASWPRPSQLMNADPANIRKLGPTLRKGESIVGLASDIVAGEVDIDFLDKTDPVTFYNSIVKIKGIGPTSAQDLMIFRNRPDGIFPSDIKKGEEKGLRKWIIRSYGGDPDNTSEADFQEMIKNWKGNESIAIEFMYANWILDWKERQAQKKAKN